MILFKHAQTGKVIATNYYVYTQELDMKYFFNTESKIIDYFLMRHPFDRLMDTYLFEIKLNDVWLFSYTHSQIPVAKALNHTHPGQMLTTKLEDVILNLEKIISYKYPIYTPQSEGIEDFDVRNIIKCESDLDIVNNDLNINLRPPNNYLPEYFDINNDLLNIIYNCYKKDYEYGGYGLIE